MILAIDIGNTNIVLGGFEGETILFIERISTNQAATDLEYASDVKTALDVHNIDPKEVQGAILFCRSFCDQHISKSGAKILKCFCNCCRTGHENRSEYCYQQSGTVGQ